MATLILVWTALTPYLLQAAQTNPDAVSQDQLSQQIALEAVRHNPANSPVGILVPLGFFALILGIVWLRWRRQQAQLQTRAEFHKQLLDKFASGREFSDFLESKASERFLESLWSQGASSRDNALRYGIVVTMLGLAFLGLSFMKKDFIIPGVLLVAFGGGLLISFAIARRLSQSRSQTSASGPGNLTTSHN